MDQKRKKILTAFIKITANIKIMHSTNNAVISKAIYYNRKYESFKPVTV